MQCLWTFPFNSTYAQDNVISESTDSKLYFLTHLWATEHTLFPAREVPLTFQVWSLTHLVKEAWERSTQFKTVWTSRIKTSNTTKLSQLGQFYQIIQTSFWYKMKLSVLYNAMNGIKSFLQENSTTIVTVENSLTNVNTSPWKNFSRLELYNAMNSRLFEHIKTTIEMSYLTFLTISNTKQWYG